MSNPRQPEQRWCPVKLGISFDSSIMFLGQIQDQKLLDYNGKDYCLMQLQVTMNRDTFLSETLVCSKRTKLIPDQIIPLDKYGN